MYHHNGTCRLQILTKLDNLFLVSELARKQQAIATTLCEELQASNCVYKSRGAPARNIGPPLI